MDFLVFKVGGVDGESELVTVTELVEHVKKKWVGCNGSGQSAAPEAPSGGLKRPLQVGMK